jgi:signal transduction histidine kinase
VSTPTDLDDIVLREVQALRRDIGVRVDTSQVSAGHLAGDAAQLERVVRNLLGNAVRHATSEVIVSLGEVDDRVRLTVADDGRGVPAEARERIFERFGRVDDARARARGGTGLGLAIVRDIVERHDGTIRYDASWKSGARFVVELPAHRAV